MTLPCQLRVGADGLLRRTPAPELTALRTAPRDLAPAAGVTVPQRTHFELDWQTGGQPLTLVVRDCAVIEWKDGILSLSFTGEAGAGRTVRRAALPALERLHLFADSSSLELFANDGAVVLSSRYYPAVSDTGLAFQAGGGTATLWTLDAPAD